MRKVFIFGIISLVLVPMLFVAALVFAPRLDEVAGIFTQRALKLVQNHAEGGHTAAELIASRFAHVEWRAFHRDYWDETYVRCDATDAAGRRTSFVWIVTTAITSQGLESTATAHNNAAFELTPNLYTRGHVLYKSPDMANW